LLSLLRKTCANTKQPRHDLDNMQQICQEVPAAMLLCCGVAKHCRLGPTIKQRHAQSEHSNIVFTCPATCSPGLVHARTVNDGNQNNCAPEAARGRAV
jgi:hypothetical protein